MCVKKRRSKRRFKFSSENYNNALPLTMHAKQRQKIRAVVQAEIALQNAFPMSCFISELQPFCPYWVY